MDRRQQSVELASELLFAYRDYFWYATLDNILTESYHTAHLPMMNDVRISHFYDDRESFETSAEMLKVIVDHANALAETNFPIATMGRFANLWPCLENILPTGSERSYVDTILCLTSNYSVVYADALAFIGLIYGAIDNPHHKGEIDSASDIFPHFEELKGNGFERCFDEIVRFVLHSMSERPADQRFLDGFNDAFRTTHRNFSQDLEDLGEFYAPQEPTERAMFEENLALTQGVFDVIPELLEEYLVTAPLSLTGV